MYSCYVSIIYWLTSCSLIHFQPLASVSLAPYHLHAHRRVATVPHARLSFWLAFMDLVSLTVSPCSRSRSLAQTHARFHGLTSLMDSSRFHGLMLAHGLVSLSWTHARFQEVYPFRSGTHCDNGLVFFIFGFGEVERRGVEGIIKGNRRGFTIVGNCR